ncbi:MAG: orc1/cdc6 family replication initiation protein [Candidatus Aenigmarchaeota archaeon]|nr:orc1/cdc6 family replication initiation protein [Candidatus Aenigmarchaeota archaeon]
MAQQTLKDLFTKYASESIIIFKDRDFLTDRYIPDDIPHREEQVDQLAKILAPSIKGQRVSNTFIFGTVGTGKSCVAKHVTKELSKISDNVKVIYINCKLKKVSDTEYRMIAEILRIMGKKIPYTGLPTDEVFKIFYETLDSKKSVVVLILDEIDALVSKIGDDILYRFTRINEELKETKLSLIGISNDTTFTDNLDPRVKSSLSEEEIIFPPYNAAQLQDILNQRAKLAFDDSVLAEGVIAKCAALAAQEHGDARKALNLLRISGEIAEREKNSKINIEHLDKAENKLDTDKTVEIVKTQPRQSQAVLAAILKLLEKDPKNIQTGDVFSLYEKICVSKGLKVLTQRRVSDLIGELDMLSIINTKIISRGRYGRSKEIKVLLEKNILKKIREILKENYLLTDNLFLDAQKNKLGMV